MNRKSAASGPQTLAIDIGGSHIKAAILDAGGELVGETRREITPHPATPESVLRAISMLAQGLGRFDRVAAGFPGVVRRGHVLTAPNLGNDFWRGCPLAALLADRLGKPARVMNDATVQGFAVIARRGIECVITLGTGFGFALFDNGRPGPHLELSHHPVWKGKTYDEYVGDAARRARGHKRWNKRVRRAIGYIETLVMYETLYIGGGNAQHIEFALPANVRIVPNVAGIAGGFHLWDPALAGLSEATPDDDAIITPAAREDTDAVR